MSNDRSPVRTDVAIAGGGVIGLALAWELLQRGLQVAVLEAAEPGSGATQAAGGMLGPIAEAQIEEPEIITFGLDSLRRYPAFVRQLEDLTGVSTGFREEGTIIAAVNRDHLNELEHLRETFRAKGLTAEVLGDGDVLDLEPRLTPRVLGGLKIREDQRIDPRRLTAALLAALAARGGTLLRGARVTGVDTAGGSICGIRAERNGEELRVACRHAVMALGADSWNGLDVPVPDPGIRPIKGQLLRLQGETLLRHVVRTPDIYLIPQPEGELLVGATMEEMGHDLAPTAGAALELLRHGWQILPGIYDLEFAGMAVGLRPAVDDHMPVIGPAGPDGLWLAVGHFRKGILMAPATASYLADWLAGGTMPSALAPFLPSRLALGAAQDPT